MLVSNCCGAGAFWETEIDDNLGMCGHCKEWSGFYDDECDHVLEEVNNEKGEFQYYQCENSDCNGIFYQGEVEPQWEIKGRGVS